MSTWTGGHLSDEITFRWSDGSLVSEYTNWLDGNPDYARKTRFCIVMSGKKYTYHWDDTYCYRKLQSVCEFPENAR